MPLHPAAAKILEMMKGAPPATVPSDPPEESRRRVDAVATARGGEPVPVHRVEDRTLPGPAGPIPVRVYRPSDERDLPVLVWFHGGGWVVGSLASFDGMMRDLANAAGCGVVSVDYRLAPEHPFPAAVEDCWAVTTWVVEHGRELGFDPSRVAVGGDSAGGNLAAVVALMARDAGMPLVLQVMTYPITDEEYDSPSWEECGEGYLLLGDHMRWFYECYRRTEADAADWRFSPLRADDLSGVCPAVLLTAEFDVLRDQGEAYARRLEEAGVPTHARRVDGIFHGFLSMGAVLPPAKEAFDEVVEQLRAAFRG
jgi:acetyl esterase